ncbi:hypothetical protein HK405_004060 [Cladochytrium tenue]|nr:hypothetical protein HK405_004060 [Cladochytrium tenue]
MQLKIVELFEDPAVRAANPKLAAYLFAGRAFMIGSGLAITGSLAATMAVAMAMKVNTLKEFSTKARELAVQRFPALRGNYTSEDDNGTDEGSSQFLKELREEIAREEAEGAQEFPEGSVHSIIRDRVRFELGPFAKGGSS